MRIIGAIAFLSSAMFAQSAFEVATVKPNKTSDAVSNHFDPERMSWSGVTLKDLIGNAYWFQSYQIVGGPAWLDSDRWEINAKTEGATTFKQKMELLGTLLADRFQLKFHRETRELKEYRLVVAEGGPKLREARDTTAQQAGTRVHRGLIAGHAMGAPDLARFLERIRPPGGGCHWLDGQIRLQAGVGARRRPAE